MTFQPGQSGNPSGRPRIVKDIQELARTHTAEAMEALVAALASPKERVAAAVALLERGWGKPVQPTTLSGPGGGPVQVEDTRESLAAILARVEATVNPETRH